MKEVWEMFGVIIYKYFYISHIFLVDGIRIVQRTTIMEAKMLEQILTIFLSLTGMEVNMRFCLPYFYSMYLIT